MSNQLTDVGIEGGLCDGVGATPLRGGIGTHYEPCSLIMSLQTCHPWNGMDNTTKPTLIKKNTKFRWDQLHIHIHIHMRKGFLIYEEMRKYLTIYEESVSHMWLCNRSFMNFLIYEENWFSFLSEYTSLWFRFCSRVGGFRSWMFWRLKQCNISILTANIFSQL